MADEKPRFLNQRLEHPLKGRVENFESRTGVSALTLQKKLLEAAMDFFESHGYIVFPIEIVVSKGPTVSAAVLAEEPAKKSAIKYADKKAAERKSAQR